MKQCCMACTYAAPSDLVGWHICTAPIPFWAPKPTEPNANDVEYDDGVNCEAFKERSPSKRENNETTETTSAGSI